MDAFEACCHYKETTKTKKSKFILLHNNLTGNLVLVSASLKEKTDKRWSLQDVFEKVFTFQSETVQLVGFKFFMAHFTDDPEVNALTNLLFHQNLGQLESRQLKELMRRIDDYTVKDEEMNMGTISTLLKWDGLILLSSDLSYNDVNLSKEGSFLIAAFIQKPEVLSPGYSQAIDYHFLRLFKDGWYECLGTKVAKKEAKFDNQFLIEDPLEVPKLLNMSNFDFVGYFLVSRDVEIYDSALRSFHFEGIKSK